MTHPFDAYEDERIARTEYDIQQKNRQEKEEQQLKEVMSTEAGRAVIWRLISDSGVFRSSFSNDPYAMAFREGERNYGLKVFNKLHQVCPELYAQMANEATTPSV
ncbi:hypothetical protein JEP65_02205 [Proteus mirabilis]|nr:hypothetical protein [Proteus mirabilis]MBI6403154.1 hypothetical protein [Proteus mirabilis]HEJ9609025.1 hypothetical protein [Proteus mirabilis]